MSPRKYRATLELQKCDEDNLYALRAGDTILAGMSLSTDKWLYEGTITSVEPIMTAEDVIDEIEKLRNEAMADLDTMLSEPPRIDRYRRLTREIDQVIAAHRSQEKPG